MKRIIILGAGPAACLLALALTRDGLAPLVIGKPRDRSAAEGLSQRVVEALQQFGCANALALLGPRWRRVSAWNGGDVEMNGEFVIERVAFDAALLDDVRSAGVTVCEGLIRQTDRDANGEWRIRWEDARGQLQGTGADLVVECRGHAAPKTAPDLHQGGTLFSLGRSFEGARAQPRTTFVESFADGWAWGAVDTLGRAHIQTVVLPETLGAHGCEPEATHAACLRRLQRMLRRFGGELRASGPVRARGIRPALRAGIAETDFLRIGDAAYTCDPLSGHGVFEAASGAIAAAPVINTLLHRPGEAALALRYLRERAHDVFFSRTEAARQHYAGETRWPDAAFWRHVAAPVSVPAASRLDAPAFAVRPVVEDGFVVERRVVVSAEHPRGVRFIDGVDLGLLDRWLRTGSSQVAGEPGAALGASRESVHRALQWLQAQQLAPGGAS